MTASAYTLLRTLAVHLRDRAAALDDHTLPPELQTILDRCRDDLAVILARRMGPHGQKVSVSDAKAMGRTACGVCNPPQ